MDISADATKLIAEQIVNQQIIGNWLYWSLFLSVSLVSGFFGSLVGSYAKKRGELKAIKADYDDILSQLRKSTRATEDIKSAISLGEWSKKEQTTLRRIKLEDLVLALEEVSDWLEQERNRILFKGDKEERRSPIGRVAALVVLYFSELSADYSAFRAAHDAAYLHLLNAAEAIVNARAVAIQQRQDDQTAALPVRREYAESFNPLYITYSRRKIALEQSCSTLMQSIVAVD